MLTFNEGSGSLPAPPRPMYRMAVMADATTPVEAGDKEIVVLVDVTVAIA